jgi:hypothetical protein
MRDLTVEQGIGQLQLLICHVRAESTQGSLAGVSFPLLHNPSQPLSFLDADLPSSIPSYLSLVNGSLHIPVIVDQLPPPLREDDTCLIDTFLALKLRQTVFKSCQRIRKYLGITYLSEIVTADGTSLTCNAWTGNRERYSPRL